MGKARPQKRVVMDFNASIHDDLEKLAELEDETAQGVIRTAVANHLRSKRAVLDSFVDPGSMAGQADLGRQGQF